MKTCCCFRCVELMRAGLSPTKAAERTVLSAHETILRHGGTPHSIALVCMNEKGETGAAANHRGFFYSCAAEGKEPAVYEVTPVIDKDAAGETVTK